MDTAFTASTPGSNAEMEAAVSQMLRQIDEIREQMKADDIEIAQIRAEKAALRAEAQALGEETRAILSNLRSTL